MKKIAMFAAFIMAIIFSSNVSAENWELVNNYESAYVYVDKDSIQRGTKSEKFPKFNREDGFSAKVKMEIRDKDPKLNMEMVHLTSFYKKDGERMLCTLESCDGANYPEKESDIIEEKVDSKGRELYKIWDYIEKNLK